MASVVADTGLYSERIRDILGMPSLSLPSLKKKEKKEPDSESDIADINTQVYQNNIKNNISQQVSLLKQLLKSNENNKEAKLSVAATILIATKTLEKAPHISKLLKTFVDIDKQLKTIAKNQRTQAGYLSKNSAFNNNRVSDKPASFLGSALDIATSVAAGASITAAVASGTGIGAGLKKAGSSALSMGSKIVSKAALPLAAAYAAYDGISSGINADSILEKKVDLADRVQVGVTEATNGILLGLPDYLSKMLTGKTFSKSVNDALFPDSGPSKESKLNEVVYSNPLDIRTKDLRDTANLLSLPETQENSKVIGETIGEYLEKYLEKIYGVFGSNRSFRDASSGSGSTPSGNSSRSSGSTNTKGSSGYMPSTTPDTVSSVIGKDAKGNNVSIPLPKQTSQAVSNDGQFGFVEPKSTTPNYSGGFVDPKSNPDVNSKVLDKYNNKQLPVVIRNNNPAALSLMNPGSGEFAERQEGYVGATPRPANEGGFYAKYATPEHGIAANAKLLERYNEKGINTTDSIVRKWSTDTSAHNSYSQTLQKALGVSGNTPLDLTNKEVQQKILMAKSGHESGAGVPIYSEDTFKRGVNREFPQVSSLVSSSQVPQVKEPFIPDKNVISTLEKEISILEMNNKDSNVSLNPTDLFINDGKKTKTDKSYSNIDSYKDYMPTDIKDSSMISSDSNHLSKSLMTKINNRFNKTIIDYNNMPATGKRDSNTDLNPLRFLIPNDETEPTGKRDSSMSIGPTKDYIATIGKNIFKASSEIEPIKTELPKQETKSDYTPTSSMESIQKQASPPVSNTTINNNSAPSPQAYNTIMSSAPSIDNEFSMLAVNSTVVS